MSTLTGLQIPDKSILDINGRQTYLGNSFVLPMPGKSLADTAETVLAFIKNPATSGNSFFFFSRRVMTNNNPVTVKFYLNPTVNVLGSATTIRNLRSNIGTLPTALGYLATTVSGTGTFLTAISATQYNMSTDVLYILDPGDNLLVTGTQVGAGTTLAFVATCWFEI